MAKRKLNKKVAITGIIILGVLAVLVGLYGLRWLAGRDPDKLVRQAEERLSKIETQLTQYRQIPADPDRQQEKEQLLEAGREDYAYVFGKYARAVGVAKDDDRKIEILFELADLHRNTNNEFYTPDWDKLRRVWYTITNIDPANFTARMKLLRYFYEAAAWSQVKEQVSGTEPDGSDGLIQVMVQQDRNDPNVLKFKARADLELATSGQATDRTGSFDEAIGDFETLLEQTPDDVEIYKYLAQAIRLKGDVDEFSGVIGAAEEAARQAEEVLRKAIETLPENAQAHINLLEMRLIAIQNDPNKVRALEPDFKAITTKFNSSAAAWASLSGYYQSSQQIDKAVDAKTNAIELDSQSVGSVRYAIAATNLHYLKSSLAGETQFQEAIDVASTALTSPAAQNIHGPKQHQRGINRQSLLYLLSRLYVEQALQALQDKDQEKHRLLIAKAEESVHEITQISGTTNVYSIMWTGLLDLARGQDDKAIRQMYNAYEQFKAHQSDDRWLRYWLSYDAYMLAEAFRNRPEIGSRLQFLEDARKRGIAAAKPKVLLDYAELLLAIGHRADAVALAKAYETVAVGNQRSRSIQVAAYIASGQFDEASDTLDGMDPDDAQTKSLRLDLVYGRIINMLKLQTQSPLTSEQQAQLDEFRRQRAEAVNVLIDTDPEQVAPLNVTLVCRDYLAQNKPDLAKALIEKFLSHKSDNLIALVFQRRLLEPDPLNISSDRFNEITLQVLSEISDPRQRALSLGRHYLSRGQYTQAVDEYNKALNIAADDKLAIDGLFDTAILQEDKDFELADRMAQKARQNNLDGCEGNFYLARLSFVRADYKKALERIELCLNSKPIYARAYHLRSLVNNAMGNLDQAIEDAQTATQMNPLDPLAARQRVAVLHERNTRLGRKLSLEQQEEIEQALRTAITLNANDGSLQSLYAGYRSSEHPEEALAQAQSLQERFPNIANHLLVANLATTISRSETDDEKRAGLVEMASMAYEKAYVMEPDNSNIQQQYSEFLRLAGRQNDAEKIFDGKDDVLWGFYLRDGRYNKAAQILHRLNEKDPEKPTIIRGLVSVAHLTGDKEGLRTYCEQLLDIEDTVDNELLQIEMYLNTGMAKEAELKLASFRERHPQELRGLLLNAWAAMLNGDLEKALSLVNRNLELDSENAAAWGLRGNINRLRRDYRQAVADLQKSKGLQPSANISYQLALAYHQSNRMSAAIGELISAIKDPMAPMHLRTTLERFYEESQQNTALMAFYDDLIAKYPDSEHWYLRASRFYMRESNFKKAEELLQKAWLITQKKDNPSAIIFDSYLEILWRQGQYQNVLSIASKYIDVPAMASIAYSQMGQSQAKMSNRDLAVQYYHKALEKCSNNDTLVTGTLRNMAQTVGADEVNKWVASKLQASPDSLIANMVAFHLAQQSGQYSKAMEYIEKSMAIITPSDPMYPQYSAQRAVTLVMGYLKTSDKKYLSQAVEQYEKILDALPMDPQALNNLAYLLAENDEQLDKAEEYGVRAHRGAPNNPNIMDTYAYTLCKNKKYAKAEKLLHTTIQLHEVEGTAVPWEVFKHLGMAQEGLEQNELAAASYKQAMQIGGDKITSIDKDKLTQAIERVSQ